MGGRETPGEGKLRSGRKPPPLPSFPEFLNLFHDPNAHVRRLLRHILRDYSGRHVQR